MRRIIGFLVLAVIAVAVAWFVAGLPGHVSIGIAGYSIEAAAPVFILLFAIFILLIVVILKLLGGILAIPAGFMRRGQRRRRRVGDIAVNRALVALAAGEKSAAKRLTARARKLLGETPNTLLLSAEAARLAGDEDEAATFYKKMVAREDAAFLGLRGLFRQAMAREDWPEASLLAKRAETVRPGTNWLREERAVLAVRTGQWHQAALLAGSGAPVAAYATAAAQAAVHHDPGDAMRLAKEAWRDHPGFAPAALVYAAALRKARRENRAQAVIREAWRKGPVGDLADFLLAPITDPLARVREATRLVGDTSDLPDSQVLLAQLSLAAGLLKEARGHADAARRAGMNQRRLWLVYAELEAREHGDTEVGRTGHRDALRRAAMADPDPAWRCEVCGTAQPKWLPVCPACQTPGKLAWGSPRFLAAPAGSGGASPAGGVATITPPAGGQPPAAPARQLTPDRVRPA